MYKRCKVFKNNVRKLITFFVSRRTGGFYVCKNAKAATACMARENETSL